MDIMHASAVEAVRAGFRCVEMGCGHFDWTNEATPWALCGACQVRRMREANERHDRKARAARGNPTCPKCAREIMNPVTGSAECYECMVAQALRERG